MMEEQKLRDYFKFDEVDIGANRNGMLTEKQKTRLTAELKSASVKKTLLAYFLFFLAAVGVIGATLFWFMSGSSLGPRLGFAFGFGLVWPVLYIFMGLLFLPPSSYLNLDLASVTGRVNIVKVQSHNNNTHTDSTRYDLYFGNRRFVADYRIGSILAQGDEYIVHYLKNSQKIVSAELVAPVK